MKILIVDDEYDSIQPFKSCIEKHYPPPTHSVVWATNVERATKILRQPTPPDLVVLDVMMRRMDDVEGGLGLENDDDLIDINAGVEFVRENGAWFIENRIPIIILTNRKSQEIRTMLEELRFSIIDDDGHEVFTTDGSPATIPFPDAQLVVATKIMEILPTGVVNRMSELLAIFRPLEG